MGYTRYPRVEVDEKSIKVAYVEVHTTRGIVLMKNIFHIDVPNKDIEDKYERMNERAEVRFTTSDRKKSITGYKLIGITEYRRV